MNKIVKVTSNGQEGGITCGIIDNGDKKIKEQPKRFLGLIKAISWIASLTTILSYFGIHFWSK